jgi:hypothetical protein
MDDDREDAAPGQGSPGFEGFMYQIDVSIWAALEFVLAKRQALQVVLEPAGYDDVEASLDEHEIGPVATSTRLVGSQLVIQAKLRNTGPWRLSDLAALLKHGKRRESVADRLKRDANSAYLLITSADLYEGARRAGITTLRATKWPDSLPHTLKVSIPSGGGRFAVLATQDPEKLRNNLQRLLEESFRVPRSRLGACLKALRDEATDRLRGGSGGVWSREQLVAILRAHGGRLARSAERESFVPPTNWAQIRAGMATNHAVILTGSSGTGKSTGAKVLAEELADATPGLTIVHVHRGPDQVRFDQTSGPVLFLIDDPWGHYRFNPGARPWNDQLGLLLETAGPDRRFIVTSRSDVLEESRAKRLPTKWYATLEAENYGRGQKLRLFENRLPQLSDDLVLMADRARAHVLEELSTPLEIQKFFDAMGEGPREKEPEPVFVQRCINAAHESAIENTVVEQVRARNALPAATILWGLLKARGKVSTETLDRIEADLGERAGELEDAIPLLVGVLVAARHLRQDEAMLSYSHPRIEKALETAIGDKPGQTARLLGTLIDTLIAMDDEMGDDWGRETAATLIAAAKEDSPLRLRVSQGSQARLNAWLAEGLEVKGGEFRRRLKMAASVGTSPICDVAAWLIHRHRPRGDFFLEHWRPKTDDPQWYSARAQDPLTAVVCAKFVREVLPNERDDYRRDFVTQVQRLAPNLTAAFLDAAGQVVGDGVNWNSEVIAEGALQDLDGFERVAEAAAQVLDDHSDYREQDLAVLNGEYSDDAAERMGEERAEDGHTANELLNEYVMKLRETRGWRALLDSRLVGQLTSHWLRALRRAEGPRSADETQALAEAAQVTGRDAGLWWLAADHWDPVLETALLARLDGNLADFEVRCAAALCAGRHAPSELVGRMAHWAEADPARLAAVVEAQFHPRTWWVEIGADDDAFLQQAVDQLGPVVGPAIQAVAKKGQPLPPESRAWLGTLDVSAWPRLRGRLAQRVAEAGGDPTPWLQPLLDQKTDDDEEDLAAAVWAASQLAEAGAKDRLRPLLMHRFADVRKVALEGLAPPAPGELPSELLALAQDRGSRVRRALVELMATRPKPAHTAALLHLTRDHWQAQSRYYGEAADFPIAQRAAEVLAEGPDVPPGAIPDLATLARETEDTDLRSRAVAVLARVCGEAGLRRLVDMVQDRTHYPLGAAAASALLETPAVVETELLTPIDGDQLLVRHATVSVEMALLLGAKSAPEQVRAVAEKVGGSATRKPLLVPLAVAALERTDGAAEAVVAMLPADLQLSLAPACYDGPPIRRTDLPAGDPRILEQVVRRLAFLFAIRPVTEGAVVEPETEISSA